MSTTPDESQHDLNRPDSDPDRLNSAQPIPTRERLSSWLLLAGALVGAVPGIVISLFFGYGGLGIALGGAIVGFLAAYEQIGPIRLLSLAFFAMVGNMTIGETVAQSAIDVTEQPPVRFPSDRFYGWILGGSRRSRPLMIAVGLVTGATIIAVLFVYDRIAVLPGRMGWIRGLRDGHPMDAEQWLFIGYCSSSVVGAIITLGFSPAHRRPLCLAGLVGILFGVIAGSGAHGTKTVWMAWIFFVLALFATQVTSVLIAVIEAYDRRTTTHPDGSH